MDGYMFDVVVSHMLLILAADFVVGVVDIGC